MSDNLENWDALGVASALANSYAEDIRGFLPLLAVVLESSLPGETELERRGGLFQKNKPVRKVTVTLGDQTYTLEDTGRGPLEAQRCKTVRGIRLKTEPMPVESWLAELSEAISSRAQRNEKAFYALKELLGG
jgi:hypothetical protein